MELKDFVAETLKQIIDGVRESQAYGSEHGAVVSPAQMFQLSSGQPGFTDGSQRPVQPIEFDVAVTASEGTKTKGGIGVFMGGVGLGSQGQSDAASRSVSRIRFTVPLVLPTVGERKPRTTVEQL